MSQPSLNSIVLEGPGPHDYGHICEDDTQSYQWLPFKHKPIKIIIYQDLQNWIVSTRLYVYVLTRKYQLD